MLRRVPLRAESTQRVVEPKELQPKRSRRRLPSCALVLAVVLLGCGDDDGTTPPADSGGGDSSMTDNDATTSDSSGDAPTVTVSPSDGATGVLTDESIVLAFSAPMDTASVESAWMSDSLPLEQLTLNWNGDDTMVSIDVSSVLMYPEGGPDVDPFDFGFTLTTDATDADGNALENPVSVNFQTARRVLFDVPNTTAGTGSSKGDASGGSPVLRPGDDDMNATWRAFLTFDMSMLPEELLDVEMAEVAVNQASVTGMPYSTLGNLRIGAIAPISEINAAAHAAPERTMIGIFSDMPTVGAVSRDVMAGVTETLEQNESTITFRLGFEMARDMNGMDDYTVLAMPTLQVRALVH